MAIDYFRRRNHDAGEFRPGRIEPRLNPDPRAAKSEVFDAGAKIIVDHAHVKVERLDTRPVLFSKVFKEFEDRKGQRYDYRYWAERENYFLREFLKRQGEFSHVVQARHLISENEAAKQVLTCDAGITVANWLRVKSRYADTATLAHPFQRLDAFLLLVRACLVALEQIHRHRIVHCDIKEDNICIPYAPQPAAGVGQKVCIEFGKLKLIDFAFSIAHAIPLTQILVINPDERLPYQSELLVSALRADRRSGSPNAVQELDYRVDLFSLGYMAGKISAAGLDCPAELSHAGVLEEVLQLVDRLKAYDTAAYATVLPHDGLIAEIDRLLARTAGLCGSPDFKVDGEWSAEEMAQGRGGSRKTPLTPVALALPTPVAVPFDGSSPRSRAMPRTRIALLLVVLLAGAAGGALLYRKAGDGPPPSSAGIDKQVTAVATPAVPEPAASPPPAARPEQSTESVDYKRIASSLHSDEDAVFQAAFAELTGLAAGTNAGEASALAKSVEAEYAEAVGMPGPRPTKSRALRRLIWMAKSGNSESAQRVQALERSYDDFKRTLTRSTWWSRGLGAQPGEAAQWIENGALLAENGDRPAMLDMAFALGHGRALPQDRAGSVETYLKAMARSSGGDELSAKILQTAARGLAATLDIIVRQRDGDAARRLLPALQASADSGAAVSQYYLGLLSECVAQPADLNAARQWYGRAAADLAWKSLVERRSGRLGRSCPR